MAADEAQYLVAKDALMFNFKRNIQERQLKRAILIQNAIMLSIFGFQRKAFGAKDDTPSIFDDLIASSISCLFGKEYERTDLSHDDKRIYLAVIVSVRGSASDEKLILRTLFDIVSLSTELKNQKVLSDYPAAIELLSQGKTNHPDIFRDHTEKTFKSLLENFADKYDPEIKNLFLKLFP